MTNRYTPYPIKTTSRAVTRKRYKRLSWFVVGTAFGIGCTSALTPIFHSAPVETAAVVQTAPVVVAENTHPIIAPAPLQDAPPAPVAIEEQEQAEADTTQYPLNLDIKVASGDTLLSMLIDAGVSHDEAYSALETAKKIYDPKKLDVGQNISVMLDKAAGSDAPVIKSMTLPISLASTLEITRTKDDSFTAKKVDMPLERRVAHAGGKINSSLYQTGYELGLSSSMLGEIINAYSYDVDFQRDIQPGDAIDVLYERLQTKDGKVARNGNLIFAELDLGDRTLRVYRYTDKDGNSDYYNDAGESIRKALLKTPINGARITSGYGMRNHPLLGYTKMHRGIDFGAPTGTPVYASGDAVVEFVGRKGGYGNFLKLKHNNSYESGYAHLSRFATGIAPGKKVKQGQIVAYVGTTGQSTGPHLHYEIFVNGIQVNPSGVKFKTGNALRGKELAAFKKTMEKIEAKLTTIRRGSSDMAMADFERDVYPTN